jgi:hypothetical protein
MPEYNIVPLFCLNDEPSAILQKKSGEYIQNIFFETWKHAVHFLAWFQINKKNDINLAYQEWYRESYIEDKFGDDEFIREFNEFRGKNFIVQVCTIWLNGKSNIEKRSLWHPINYTESEEDSD